MAQEVDTNFFINFIGKIKDCEKVVNEARKLGQEVQKAANMEGMTPQSKPVEQTAGAYEKLNQSVNAHNKVITELQKLQGGEQLAQKERLSVIREITTARAKGVIGENQFSEELKKTSTAYNDVNAASKKTLLSIARWAIGWTAVYSVIRGIKSAISSTVKDALALEQQIYRAISASRFERGGAMPTGSEIGQLRDIYTRELIDLVRGTSASIRDSGQALFFLSTAGLTAKESLAAMEPVLNLSIAAFGNLQEIARLTSGIYNVFGEQMQGFRTQQEAMTHIVDVLAYAYRNQQIEISEITTAMQFSAQMAGVMDIRFEDLIGTIGFLGTGMLRGSKAGTSLFNSFLQIADKSDMLRDKLGVVFDPSAPMDFVDIMEQLHNTFGDGAMSLGNMNLLFDVFGRRGGRAVAEILNRWDDWRESIRASKEEVAGTAEEMRKTVEESNIAQWKIFFNEIKSTLIEQLNPALKIMALSLGIINEKIKTTDYEKQFKAAKREVKEAISMMDGKGKSAMQDLVLAGVDFAGGWTSVIASTRQWIKEMQEAGRITEDVANTLETGFVNNLKNLARMGNAPLTESALSRKFEVAKLQAMKYQTILKQRAKTTKEVNDIDYSLVHTLEALRKERELNLLQAGGYNESMLAELKVSIALREGYADLLNAYNLRKQQLDEQPDLDIKLPNLPSFSEYSRAITEYQGAIEKSAESGERVWNNFRKSLIVTTKDGKKELYSLAGTAEDANKIISTLFGADIARMTQINTRLLQDYVNEVAKLNNRFQIQSEILKALGADDVSLANFRLSHMDMLINRQQERVNILKKEKAGTILLQNAEQELFDLQLQRATAVGGTIVALINEQRTAYKEMYSELSSDLDIFYKKRELALKVAGADDRDLLLLARDRVVAEQEMIRAQLAMNELNTLLLPEYVGLTEEEKKKLKVQYESYRIKLLEADIDIDLYDISQKINYAKDELNRKEDILSALGYSNLEIAGMMLNALERQDVIKGRELEKLTKQYQLMQELAAIEERRRIIQEEMSVKEAMVSGWSDVSSFVGVMKREEMLRNELELARQIADEKERSVRVNYINNELLTIEYDKQKAVLSDMRDVMGGIGDSIYGLISGTKDWRDVMDNLNQVVLKKSIEILTEMLMRMLMMKALGLFSGGLFGGGGTGASMGDWNIPTTVSAAGGGIMPNRESIARLHPREMVLPSEISDFVVSAAKSQSGQNGQAQSFTVVNMIHDDSIASSLSRRKDVVVNIIGADLQRNGITRRSIRRSL